MISELEQLEQRLEQICTTDVDTLLQKGKQYGNSWKKRGGIGAMMMLARKWDRIENTAARHKYHIFEASLDSYEDQDGLLDDIAELRRYLLLVEDEARQMYKQQFDVSIIGLSD